MVDGGLLVEVSTPAKGEKLRGISPLNGTPVVVSPHDSLNYVRGVVSSRELLPYPEEELARELSDQGVVKVRRHPRRAGGVPFPQLSS